VSKTSTPTAASAQPLQNFISGLPLGPTLKGDTNWDLGLAQVAAGFDEVIFLTDGAPTMSRIRSGPMNISLFTTYSGDANNEPATSACTDSTEQVSIAQQALTVLAETGSPMVSWILMGLPLALLGGGLLLLVARRRRNT
jgi:LPXTG-motif cell wall-anchored protein